MNEIERLLTAGLVEFAEVDPSHPDAQRCLIAYFAELDERFDTGFDPGDSTAPHVEGFRPPYGLCLVAFLRNVPIGCGALSFHRDAPPDIKRMWVDPSARGLGVGRRLLTELEGRAAEHGATAVRLETNRNLVEAIAMYRAAGYVEVPAFNNERYAHHWFERTL